MIQTYNEIEITNNNIKNILNNYGQITQSDMGLWKNVTTKYNFKERDSDLSSVYIIKVLEGQLNKCIDLEKNIL